MNILLACAAGMSTSLVVARMQEAAQEEGKDYKIWAMDFNSVENEKGNFDVLLLGPQVIYMKNKMKEIVNNEVPVDVIAPTDYGRCDGKAVLHFAENVYKKFHTEGVI